MTEKVPPVRFTGFTSLGNGPLLAPDWIDDPVRVTIVFGDSKLEGFVPGENGGDLLQGLEAACKATGTKMLRFTPAGAEHDP